MVRMLHAPFNVMVIVLSKIFNKEGNICVTNFINAKKKDDSAS